MDDVGLIPGHRSAYMAVGLNARPMGRAAPANGFSGTQLNGHGSTVPGSVNNKR
jgi:hypothetical protein